MQRLTYELKQVTDPAELSLSQSFPIPLPQMIRQASVKRMLVNVGRIV